jgi:hypothetical protein
VLSSARFEPGHERLPTGRHPDLRDRARQRVDRFLVAIGARNLGGQHLDPSCSAVASAAPAGPPLAAGVEPWTLTELSRFVYELLDAHDDTARIVHERDVQVFWDAHLDYLRALQRKGRELLARLDSPTTGPGP